MGEVHKTGETPVTPGIIHDITRARRRTGEPAQPPLDDAVIGERAREMSRAATIVETAPDIRAFRVAQLRAQIERGDYEPDAREIARQILSRGL